MHNKTYRFFLEAELYHGPDYLFSRCKRDTCVEYDQKAKVGDWNALYVALDRYFDVKLTQYKNYYGESAIVALRFVDRRSGATIREYTK